jgi:hypothetical protein
MQCRATDKHHHQLPQLVSKSEPEDKPFGLRRMPILMGILPPLHHALAAFATLDTYLQAQHTPEWSV